jgi:EAL domain-containing protein (putative c-di-GMP-specific phosphodiesterase class I)
VLDSLKALCMTIMLDDFGTGYSSTTSARLPVDTLKVDLSRIGLPPASDAHRILSAMIELAQALGLGVVAGNPSAVILAPERRDCATRVALCCGEPTFRLL